MIIRFSLQAEESDPSPLLSTERPHQECSVQLWAPQFERHRATRQSPLPLERDSKMIKALKHLSLEERLRQFSQENRWLSRISSMHTNTWGEGEERRGPGSFQWCPVPGQEAMGTSWNTGVVVWTSGNTLLLWERWSNGTCCLKNLLSFHP